MPLARILPARSSRAPYARSLATDASSPVASHEIAGSRFASPVTTPRRSPRSSPSIRSSASSPWRSSASLSTSVLLEVALELPGAHLRDVFAPLLAFRFHEVRRDVFSECPGDHVVL